MIDDTEVLRRYVDEKSQAAFAELVRRHVDLVHSAALRRVGGDAHAAADVTQQVFAVLARRAPTLARGVVLPAWLYATTRNIAVDFVRAERRRRIREQEAYSMNEVNSRPQSAEWGALRPLLDEAMDKLSERDREVVVLRFFARRPLAEIGRALHLTEDAVRMRVSRALGKLHALLARRGFTSSAAVVVAALEAHAISSAPAELAASVSGTAAGASVGLATAWFGGMSKATLPLACSVGVAFIVVAAALHDRASAHDAPHAAPARHTEVDGDPLPAASVSVTLAPTAAAVPDDDLARGRVFLAAHPDMEAAFAWSRNRMFENNWGRHLRRLNLSTREYAALRDKVLRAADWTFRTTTAGWAFEPSVSPEVASQANDKMTARLLECLGDTRARDYKEAYAWRAVDDFVRAVVVATYDTETPVTREQVAALTDTLSHLRRRKEVANPPFLGATGISVHDIDWNALERELGSRFLPAQIGVVRHVWASTRAQHRAATAQHVWLSRMPYRGPAVQLPRDEPVLQAHELATARAALALEYGAFYRELRLRPQQVARFESLLIEHEGRMRDIRAAARGTKIDPTRTETREAITVDGQRIRVLVDGSIAALRREEDARFTAAMVDVLGTEGYARWQEFAESAGRRAFVAELAGQLALTAAPLTAAQGREITAALREGDYHVNVGAQDTRWDAILARAQLVLAPDQFFEMEELAAHVRSQAAWNRLSRVLEKTRRG